MQTILAPSRGKYTSFNAPGGKFNFCRMPIGFKTISQTWCRLMDMVFSVLLGHGVFEYLDDIIIYAKSIEEHLKISTEVFDQIKNANLLLDPKKFFFLRREAQVLGHIVGSNQLKLNPEKISAVKDFPTPNTLKKLRGFLGLCSYYRRFIKKLFYHS